MGSCSGQVEWSITCPLQSTSKKLPNLGQNPLVPAANATTFGGHHLGTRYPITGTPALELMRFTNDTNVSGCPIVVWNLSIRGS